MAENDKGKQKSREFGFTETIKFEREYSEYLNGYNFSEGIDLYLNVVPTHLLTGSSIDHQIKDLIRSGVLGTGINALTKNAPSIESVRLDGGEVSLKYSQNKLPTLVNLSSFKQDKASPLLTYPIPLSELKIEDPFSTILVECHLRMQFNQRIWRGILSKAID